MPLLVILEKLYRSSSLANLLFKTFMCLSVKKSQHPSTSGVLYLENGLVPIMFCLLSTQLFIWTQKMALNLPESLVNLEANCGLYAIWMLFQHHGVDVDVNALIQSTKYDDQEGTYTIALAIALKKFGFKVSFYTDQDPNIEKKERSMYGEAKKLNIPILPALSYAEIQQATEQGKFVIVYYDTLDEVGNQSLVYSMDDNEICFFDSFDPMPALLFENQRKAEGICRQAIIIDDVEFQMRSALKN